MRSDSENLGQPYREAHRRAEEELASMPPKRLSGIWRIAIVTVALAGMVLLSGALSDFFWPPDRACIKCTTGLHTAFYIDAVIITLMAALAGFKYICDGHFE